MKKMASMFNGYVPTTEPWTISKTPDRNCHRCHRAGHETIACRATTTAYGIPLTDDTDEEEEILINTEDEFIGEEGPIEHVEPFEERRRISSTNECVTCGRKIEDAEECISCVSARQRLDHGIKKLRSRYRHDIAFIKKCNEN